MDITPTQTDSYQTWLSNPNTPDWILILANSSTVNMALKKAYQAGAQSPSPAPEIASIAHQIRTQDNRITDQPMFIVQEQKRIYGMADGYADGTQWVHSGRQETANERQTRILDKMEHSSREITDWEKIGYIDRWEFVTACFTARACTEFIKLDGHNHGELRIYAIGTHRNNEFRIVRNMLIGLSHTKG